MKKPCVWVVEEKLSNGLWIPSILRFTRMDARYQKKLQNNIVPSRKFRITKYAPAKPSK